MCFFYIKACQHILLHQIHKIMIFKKASYDPLKQCFCTAVTGETAIFNAPKAPPSGKRVNLHFHSDQRKNQVSLGLPVQQVGGQYANVSWWHETAWDSGLLSLIQSPLFPLRDDNVIHGALLD